MNRRSVGRIASAAAVLTLGSVGYSAVARSRNRYYDGPVTDHFDGVRFFGPGPVTDRGMLDLARWQISGAASPGLKATPALSSSARPSGSPGFA